MINAKHAVSYMQSNYDMKHAQLIEVRHSAQNTLTYVRTYRWGQWHELFPLHVHARILSAYTDMHDFYMSRTYTYEIKSHTVYTSLLHSLHRYAILKWKHE